MIFYTNKFSSIVTKNDLLIFWKRIISENISLSNQKQQFYTVIKLLIFSKLKKLENSRKILIDRYHQKNFLKNKYFLT